MVQRDNVCWNLLERHNNNTPPTWLIQKHQHQNKKTKKNQCRGFAFLWFLKRRSWKNWCVNTVWCSVCKKNKKTLCFLSRSGSFFHTSIDASLFVFEAEERNKTTDNNVYYPEIHRRLFWPVQPLAGSVTAKIKRHPEGIFLQTSHLIYTLFMTAALGKASSQSDVFWPAVSQAILLTTAVRHQDLC